MGCALKVVMGEGAPPRDIEDRKNREIEIACEKMKYSVGPQCGGQIFVNISPI